MSRPTNRKGNYKFIIGAIILAAIFFIHRATANKKSTQLSITESSTATPAPHIEPSAQEAVPYPTKITVVAATNRKNSLTEQVADYYAELLKKKGCETQVLKLIDLPADFSVSALYENKGTHSTFNQLKDIMEVSQKYVFIVPEYNGSFPGVFKTFIDGLMIPDTFQGKRCAMVGVSAGPRGGVFAMNHLTDIFQLCKMDIYPSKPSLPNVYDSQLATLLANEAYVKLLEEQAEGFIKF